jgi:hypothetical protein
MILFIVARSRLGRYEALLSQLRASRGVKVLLDRREGERRALGPMFSGVDRRRVERRLARPDLRKLGWSVVDTDENGS